jgi:hypothetical protein
LLLGCEGNSGWTSNDGAPASDWLMLNNVSISDSHLPKNILNFYLA